MSGPEAAVMAAAREWFDARTAFQGAHLWQDDPRYIRWTDAQKALSEAVTDLLVAELGAQS